MESKHFQAFTRERQWRLFLENSDYSNMFCVTIVLTISIHASIFKT